MQRWSEQASRRLRDGERIETTVPIGENGIVVTSQRVLAFTPDGDGSNFRAIERPNVERVGRKTTGETGWLGYALRGLIAGVAGVGVGLVVDFDSLIDLGKIDPQAAGRTGMGGMLGLLGQISNAVGMLDEALLVGGLLGFAAALGAVGMYIESRTAIVEVTVAGDADLHVPSADGDDDAVARLRRHLSGTPAGEPLAEAAESSDRGTLGTIVDSLTGDDADAAEEPTEPAVDDRPEDDTTPDAETRGTSAEASPDEVSAAIGTASEDDAADPVETGESTDAAEEIREASESAREAPAEEVADEILDFDDEE
ncbi:hypothetical protein ACOZ4N_13870 [Halorientalis pallida]|uniref:hypothetical protein n=1 Tax=Halorientalis pallida TaxID=2479928 RepID=UPI003C6F5349